jgi:hypothetical protein
LRRWLPQTHWLIARALATMMKTTKLPVLPPMN